MASTIATVQDALRTLSAAGPFSSRPAVPDVGASDADVLDEIDSSFPVLRHEIWEAGADVLGQTRVPGKYVKKLADELTYGLQIAGELGKRESVAAHLTQWLWSVSALIAKLAAFGRNEPFVSTEVTLPPLLDTETGEPFSNCFKDMDTGAPSSASAGGALASATPLSKLDDVIPLAQAALFLFTNIPTSSISAFRKGSLPEPVDVDMQADDSEKAAESHAGAVGSTAAVCPATALASAAVKLLMQAIKLQANNRKSLSSLLNPMRSRIGIAAHGLAGSALLPLLLAARDRSLADAVTQQVHDEHGCSTALHAQIVALVADIESVIDTTVFAHDLLPNYGSAMPHAVVAVQHAVLTYDARKRSPASSSASAASSAGAADQASDAAAYSKSDGGKSASTEASSSVKKAKSTASDAGSQASGGKPPKAVTASVVCTLYRPPVISGERRVFDILCGTTDSDSDGTAAKGQHGSAAASGSRTIIDDEQLLRSAPYLLTSYIRARRTTAASDAEAPTAILAAKEQQSNDAKKRKREEPGNSAGAGSGAAMATVSALQKNQEFAFTAELLSLCLGFQDPGSAAMRFDASTAADSLFFTADQLVDDIDGATDGDALDGQLGKLSVRLRCVAALLTILVECNIYNIHEDKAPHTQTAFLSAVAAWLVSTVKALSELDLDLVDESNMVSIPRGIAACAAALLELNHTLLASNGNLRVLLEHMLPFCTNIAECGDVAALPPASSSLTDGGVSVGESGRLLDSPLEGADGVADAVAGVCSAFLSHLISVFSRLRQMDVVLSEYANLAKLATGSDGDGTGANSMLTTTFLHRILLSDGHLRAFGLAIRNLPPGQVQDIGDTLIGTLEDLTQLGVMEAMALPAAASASSSSAGAASSADAVDSWVLDDAMEAATNSSLMVHAYSTFVCEYLRQLQVGPSTAQRCLHKAVRVAYGSAAHLVSAADEITDHKGPDSPLYMLTSSALQLLLASTDVAITCAPYPSISKIVPSIYAGGKDAAGTAGASILWPMDVLRPAAEGAGPLPNGPSSGDDDDDDDDSTDSDAAMDAGSKGADAGMAAKVKGGALAAALTKAYSAAAPAQPAPKQPKVIASDALSSLIDVIGWILSAKKRVPNNHTDASVTMIGSTFQPIPTTREACLLACASRLRLLHAMISLEECRAGSVVDQKAKTAPSMSASAQRQLATRFANHLLRYPSRITSSALELAAVYGSADLLTEYVRTLLDPHGDAATAAGVGSTTSLTVPWRGELLRDAHLYELGSIVQLMGPSLSDHIRESLRALLDCFTKQVGPATTVAAAPLSAGKKDKKGSKNDGAASALKSEAEDAFGSITMAIGEAASLVLSDHGPGSIAALHKLLAVASSSDVAANAAAGTGTTMLLKSEPAAVSASQHCQRLVSLVTLLSALPSTVHEHAVAAGKSDAVISTAMCCDAIIHRISINISLKSLELQDDLKAASHAIRHTVAVLLSTKGLAQSVVFDAGAGVPAADATASALKWFSAVSASSATSASASALQSSYASLLAAGLEAVTIDAVASAGTDAKDDKSGSKASKRKSDSAAAAEPSKKERRKAITTAASNLLSSIEATSLHPFLLQAALQAITSFVTSADDKIIARALTAASTSLLTAASTRGDRGCTMAALECAVTLACRSKDDDLSDEAASIVSAASASLATTTVADAARSLSSVARSLEVSFGHPFHGKLASSLVTSQLLQMAASAFPAVSSKLALHIPLSLLPGLATTVSAALIAAVPSPSTATLLRFASTVFDAGAKAYDRSFFAAINTSVAAIAGAVRKSDDGDADDDTAAPTSVPAGQVSDCVGSGTGAARDALTTFARALLPGLAASMTTGSISASPSAESTLAVLGLLRSIAVAPRLLPLSTADFGLLVQALTCLQQTDLRNRAASAAASVTSTSLHAGAVPQALVQHGLPVDRQWIDIGRAYGEGNQQNTSVAAASTAPIIANATQWTRAVLGSSSTAVATKPPSSTSSAFAFDGQCLSAAAWLLHGILKHRRDSALACMPVISPCLQSVLNMALNALPASDAAVDGYPSTPHLSAVVRLCEQFSKMIRMARYHVVNVLCRVVDGMAAPMRTRRGMLPSRVREAVAPGVYALLDACGPRELQQLHAMLSSRPAARALLKSLHKEYEASHKYTGKV